MGERVRGAVAFARETWRNDGAEGETVHLLADEAERAMTLEKERDKLRSQLENVLDTSLEGAWMARALDAERVRDVAMEELEKIEKYGSSPGLLGFAGFALRRIRIEGK